MQVKKFGLQYVEHIIQVVVPQINSTPITNVMLKHTKTCILQIMTIFPIKTMIVKYLSKLINIYYVKPQFNE